MNNVTITAEEYNQLLADRAMLECLEACGVDNWCGYDAAQQLYEDDYVQIYGW